MKNIKINYAPRDIDAGDYFENFLISSISSVITIRLFLGLANSPMISWANYHIAHMLFGGIILTFSLFILLTFISKESKTFASILGGIGFGIFIDELGKFITKDNNYWYRPSIALIYIIFILLFFLTRYVEKNFKYRKEEYAINALDALKQAILNDLDINEKKKSLSLLARADGNNDMVKILEDAVKKFSTIKPVEPSLLSGIKKTVKKFYLEIRDKPLFINSVTILFSFISVYNFFLAITNILDINSFLSFSLTVFPLISSIIVFYGLYKLLFVKNSRRSALIAFRYALLISIFLTQYFRFVNEQLSAVSILFFDLIILNVIQYAIYEETQSEKGSDNQ